MCRFLFFSVLFLLVWCPTVVAPVASGQGSASAQEAADAAARRATAQPRDWHSLAGRFVARGEFFAANADTVVIRRRNGSLVSVALADLASDDQAFVREARAEIRRREVDDAASGTADSLQAEHTWTSREGFELRGRVIAFGRRDVVLARSGGVTTVNGTAFSRLDAFRQHIVLQIVAEMADPAVETERDLDRWIRGFRGQQQKFTVEGVMLRLADGVEIPMPFFLLSEADLEILRPGWEQWESEQASEESRQREDFLLEVQAQEYQRDRQQASQIEMMNLELMAAATGITTIWEVTLMPRPGVYARPMSVVVSARDSLQAQQMALSRFPGYVVGPVRSLNR